MHITADMDRCIGAGQCVLAAPTVFDQTEDEGLVVVLRADPPADLEAEVETAIAACPSQTLTITP